VQASKVCVAGCVGRKAQARKVQARWEGTDGRSVAVQPGVQCACTLFPGTRPVRLPRLLDLGWGGCDRVTD
jgi:hypothetical protein